MLSRADPRETLRSIVSQLSTTEKDQYVAPILQDKSEASGPDSGPQRPLDDSDCVDILVEISRLFPITIVIDAIDECDRDKKPHLDQAY